MNPKVIQEPGESISTTPKVLSLGVDDFEEYYFQDYFFGMPDNSVYLLQTKPYKTDKQKTYLEIIVYLIPSYIYDYEKELKYDLLSEEGSKLPMSGGMLSIREKKLVKSFKGYKRIPSRLTYMSIAKKCYSPRVDKKNKKSD